ncbi:MAG: D-2-hydroxyacid dehydrogenase, partial [Gemmiger sp.]
MSKHILVALPANEGHIHTLTGAVPAYAYRFTTQETVTLEEILWADAILGNVPVELIQQNRHLEWFQSNFAGPDAYLQPGVLPDGCVVTNATGAYGLAIAEWMLGMWLGLLKDLFLYRDRQNRREWDPITRPVRSIHGSRVVCVGLGDIGSSFARRAHMLGAEVVGVRRQAPSHCPPYCLRVVGTDRLDEELAQADLVALSLPGTPETRRLFDGPRLAKIKPGAILLNVGRGSAVDADALAEAVRSGQLYGAAVDVTDPEPLPPEHPLWGLPTVLITPHTS